MTELPLSFLRPGWLLALLPLGLLLWRVWRSPAPGAGAWTRVVDTHLLAHLLLLPPVRRRGMGVALLAGGLLLSVLALAGPTLGSSPQAAQQRDVLRLVVLDLSPGMAAPLETVKLKLRALLDTWSDGQTALLVYGGEPYLVVPPTTDVETIALFVPELAPDVLPVPGNQPERALRMAGDVFERSAAQQRELVWVTTGSAGTALPLDALAGVRLSIWQTGGATDPALAEAARRSGGLWLPLSVDDADIRQLTAVLASRADWSATESAATAGATDLGYWLLPPLLLLAALAFRRGLLLCMPGLMLTGLLAGLVAPTPAQAQEFSVAAWWADVQAWRLLQASQPEAAAARFADPRWRAVAQYRAGQFEQAASSLASGHDADAHYNRGNALAQQGKLADALVAYEQALALRAADADTLYNRDLVRRLLKPPAGSPLGGKGGAPPPPGAGPSAAGPEPAKLQPVTGLGSTEEREAERVAQQWLRRIPDQPGSLLRRKLLAEQRRRQSAEGGRPW
jgi:Ca-activated chloride channel family protein